MTVNQEVVAALVAILRPLKGTGESNHDEDKFTPDEPIRDAVGEALKQLNVDGFSGCRLCGS